MFRIKVIGIADSLLSTRQYSLLTDCLLVVGAERMRDMAADFADRYLSITPMQASLTRIRDTLEHGNVAVLASGDPLFYGIGRKLLAEFGEKRVDFFPALSSIQRACALFRLPWDDARITSLHGRDNVHLPGILLQQGKHLVLTDADNSPDRIAGHLLHYLQSVGATELVATIRILVAEDLGLAGERIFAGNLGEASTRRFSALNIVCLLIPPPRDLPPHRFGLGEEQLHHSRGLITKNEVRAATLHQLRLPESGIFWDIGAGSGSLSIEAARINPQLTVFAVEQKEEELKNIKNNIVKFRCFNIVAHSGRAPETLADLPPPQRVFVGGSGGSLPAIVAAVAGRLTKGGILVINGVIETTRQMAPELLRAHGFTVRESTIEVRRTDPDGNIQTFNPITIYTGTR